MLFKKIYKYIEMTHKVRDYEDFSVSLPTGDDREYLSALDQMHVPDTKTTRTTQIYDKTGASLDWIRFNSVFILRVISFRFY
jgi:hypothetical protein